MCDFDHYEDAFSLLFLQDRKENETRFGFAFKQFERSVVGQVPTEKEVSLDCLDCGLRSCMVFVLDCITQLGLKKFGPIRSLICRLSG